MNTFLARLRDRDVLVRLNAFILSYFGWIAFGVLYGYIGKWSVDITKYFLKLPLTSKSLVIGLLSFTKSLTPLYDLLKSIYYFGFAGSIGFMVFYVLLYLQDFQTSDELLARYIMAYCGAGAIYLLFHTYAPHYIYHIPGYSMENTLLTRQEFVLPSLHNTFAAINIMTVWKYRKRLGGKVLIVINTLIPFATVLLGHHWIYDVITGFLLAIAVSRVTNGWAIRIPMFIYSLELKSLEAITMFNIALATLMFLIALDPQKWILLIRSILNQP